MSSILKALRKVEDEKASLGEGSVNLAHDILKRNYDERRPAPWRTVAVLSLTVVIVAIVAWWFFSVPQQSPVLELKAVSAEPKQQPVCPDTAKASPSTEVPVEKPVVVLPAVKPIPAQTKTTVVVKAVGVEIPIKSNEVKAIDLPELRVEEIVYHQDPASRLAVINDLPVMVGTDIEGARVEEILPDQVRFSYQGISFVQLKKQ